MNSEPLEYIEFLGEASKWYRQAPHHDYGWWIGPTTVMVDDIPVGMFDYEDGEVAVYRSITEPNLAITIGNVLAALNKEIGKYGYGSPERVALNEALRSIEGVVS